MTIEETTPPTVDDSKLNAKELRVYRSERGILCMSVGVDAVHEDIRVRRAFPLLHSDRYIGFIQADGEELGMLEDPQDLDSQSLALLNQELEKTYFLPIILEFRNMGEEHNVIFADVETSSGSRTIYVRGYRNKIRSLPGNRAIIEDVDGNRYEVRNLDSFSKLTLDILGL
jgi:hypothetical protein